MKAPPFSYRLASDASQAMELYALSEGDAVYLAGGHSIVPSLALRLQAPSMLIDISRIDELFGISVSEDCLRIGAMTTHADLLDSPLVRQNAPLLVEAAAHVAHPAIRNRATLGGNLVLADPASEFPAVIRCLGAVIEVLGPHGMRDVPADEFFVDLYTTALEPGEILRAVRIQAPVSGESSAFLELSRRHGDFAMVGAAVRIVFGASAVERADIVFHSVANAPVRAVAAEAVLRGRVLQGSLISEACAALASDLAPTDDPVLPGATRLHLARVVLGRLLHRLMISEPEDRAA